MTTNVQSPLLEKIKEKRDQEGLNDFHFSKKLGITSRLWYMTLRGERPPGITLLKLVIRAYPDLGQDVLNFLSGNGNRKAPQKPYKSEEGGLIAKAKELIRRFLS